MKNNKINQSRWVETFLEMVQISSESKAEGEMQSYLKALFLSLGLEVLEDDNRNRSGCGANNLLCRWSGDKSKEAIFFSAHMDTVCPGLHIKPVVKKDKIYSDQTTVLGADDKAGIAIMVEMIRVIQENNLPHGDLEFIISVGEESGLAGIKCFDFELLTANMGFVLDMNGPVGDVIIQSPFHFGIVIKIEGKAAHAGLEPEKGISALAVVVEALKDIKLGRIDKETTANIGLIQGGKGSNVVMETVDLVGEVRSLCLEKCESEINFMREKFQQVAEKLGAKVIFRTEKKYDGYKVEAEHKVVQIASQAIRNVLITPKLVFTGGGADANIISSWGKEVVNLSIGYDKIHSIYEELSIPEAIKAVKVSLEIVSLVYNSGGESKRAETTFL